MLFDRSRTSVSGSGAPPAPRPATPRASAANLQTLADTKGLRLPEMLERREAEIPGRSAGGEAAALEGAAARGADKEVAGERGSGAAG